MGSLSLLQGIFPTSELNWGLLHCRWILYQLSNQGSPIGVKGQKANNWISLVAQTVKNLPTVWETWVWSLGQEDTLENGMTTHSCIPAWRIPWTEEAGGLQSMGLPKSWTWLSNEHIPSYSKWGLGSLYKSLQAYQTRISIYHPHTRQYLRSTAAWLDHSTLDLPWLPNPKCTPITFSHIIWFEFYIINILY